MPRSSIERVPIKKKKHVKKFKSSGSQFFRTITGIQSGSDVFDKSRLILTFLTILGVAKICSFGLVLEGKTGKEIPES